MDFKYYLDIMKSVAKRLDKELLRSKQIQTEVGIYTDSVYLKLFKKSWVNPVIKKIPPESKIFFSVWINDQSIDQEKLWYNIHALKLRQLNGYTLESRKFAEGFRKEFKSNQHQWKNVSVLYGPQTLMQGWVKLDLKNIKEQSFILANQFLTMDDMIDNHLAKFKKTI